MRKTYSLLMMIVLLTSQSVFSNSRIKDITSVAGVRDNQLVGYGLVVGLDGTGDKTSQSAFTEQTFRNMLLQFGIKIPHNLKFELKNVAAVAISAQLPPFAKIGQKIDVSISSLGSATSLRGGELLMTELHGADNEVYAVAQGSVIVSGFGAAGSDGSKVTVNSQASGRIPSGATVENTIEPPFIKNGIITFQLSIPDFTTAERMATTINRYFRRRIARPIDASGINVDLTSYVKPVYEHINTKQYKDQPEQYEALKQKNMGAYVKYISRIENLTITPANTKARIIVNSRTGTIVIDQNVYISSVAVAHGNLSVVVSETPFVSQPGEFSAGDTVAGTASDISIIQSQNRAFVLNGGETLKDLVDEINRVGAAPGDIISILEAIKAAGALHADLEVI